jgi:hypothetical protein
VTVVVLCAAVATAFAGGGGPPFITDDPEPVDYKHWEVYFASIHSNMGGAWAGTAPHIEVNYGAAPNLQLHVIAPWSYTAGPNQPTVFGYGATELGMKYRFVQEDEKGSRPMIGIFPLIEVPTGPTFGGLGTNQAAWFLPVWLQKSKGNLTTYGGGGYWHNPGPGLHDYWYTGVAFQYQARSNLSVGFELFHTTPQAVGAGDITGFNVGAIYDFNEGHHLMFSVGTGMQGQDHGTAYLAYQWTFGPHEKKEK